ncbi:unnamed protein product [Schistocephalus solidus]|uniref:Lipoma HMGIC fusion partner-like 2 protein n=1 Tax=Schistocephalus solidus TaxID=70667 RepID=A0A183SKI8_SCHSO|nr:unnamed protein product [Schistocephalus solidus]
MSILLLLEVVAAFLLFAFRVKSCGDAFYEVIKDSWLYLGIVIIIIAVLEVGAIASACILQSKINTYESV